MRRFKIERESAGVVATRYANTVRGAVRVARYGSPELARVFEWSVSYGVSGWELVAVITGDHIQAEDHQSRESYKAADALLMAARSYMEVTYATMMAFNQVADREYKRSRGENQSRVMSPINEELAERIRQKTEEIDAMGVLKYQYVGRGDREENS